MEGFDRRKFLKGSSVAAGLAGAITVVPGAIPALAKSTAARPAAAKPTVARGDNASSREVPSNSDPVVLHVRDARSGRIDMFVGQQHMSLNDRALARHIMSAIG